LPAEQPIAMLFLLNSPDDEVLQPADWPAKKLFVPVPPVPVPIPAPVETMLFVLQVANGPDVPAEPVNPKSPFDPV